MSYLRIAKTNQNTVAHVTVFCIKAMPIAPTPSPLLVRYPVLRLALEWGKPQRVRTAITRSGHTFIFCLSLARVYQFCFTRSESFACKG